MKKRKIIAKLMVLSMIISNVSGINVQATDNIDVQNDNSIEYNVDTENSETFEELNVDKNIISNETVENDDLILNENEIFEVKSYDWNEEDSNDYHFYHKPSGLKVCWYKYPLRSPMSNMKDITHEQFLAVLRDCWNSMKTGIYYDVDSWWK